MKLRISAHRRQHGCLRSGGTSAAERPRNPRRTRAPQDRHRAAAVGRRGRQRRSDRATASSSPSTQANAAGGVGGYTLEDNIQDDAVNGAARPGAGRQRTCRPSSPTLPSSAWSAPSTRTWRAAQIPVTQRGRPGAVQPGEHGHRPDQGGLRQVPRQTNPDKRNYFRVATPDDIQGPAMARLRLQRSGRHKASSSMTPRRSASASRTRSATSSSSSAAPSSSATATTPRRPPTSRRSSPRVKAIEPGRRLLRRRRRSPAAASSEADGPAGLQHPVRRSRRHRGPRPRRPTGAFITLAGVENSGDTLRHGRPASTTSRTRARSPTDYKAHVQGRPGRLQRAGAYACAQASCDGHRRRRSAAARRSRR